MPQVVKTRDFFIQTLLKKTGLAGVPDSGLSYQDRVLAYSPAAYWPLNEESGTVVNCLVNASHDGLYTVSAGGVGGGTGPDGNPCVYLDGVSDVVALLTDTFKNSTWVANEGTILLWFKPFDASIWTDATNRYLFEWRVDASNDIYLLKSSVANRVISRYAAGGLNQAYNWDALSHTDWKCYGLVWSKTNNVVQHWYNGAESGDSDAYTGTDWAGVLGYMNIGTSYVASTGEMKGYFAHVAYWGSKLADAALIDLATV